MKPKAVKTQNLDPITTPSSNKEIAQIKEEVDRRSKVLDSIREEMAKVIVGQEEILNRLLTALVTRGHVLLEGVPGLAKTTMIKTLAQIIQTRFQRISFTPDLLPSDLIGTQIYNPQKGTFSIRQGPIFTNFLLADEINRAPAKVQSALLEAMQERQVTLGDKTIVLEEPFFVLATQNPIEQEGTYPLPEAQVDRFMLKVIVRYPSRDEEKQIVLQNIQVAEKKPKKIISPKDLHDLQNLVRKIYMDPKILDYIVSLVFASRNPSGAGLGDELDRMIEYGASPRATIALGLASRAQAFLAGRPYVTPQDVKTIAPDVLRHRLILTYEAEAENKSSDDIIQVLLDRIPVP